MKYKKTIFQKIFKIKETCYKEGCGHVFEDGDECTYIKLIFNHELICKKCFDELQESEKRSKELYLKAKEFRKQLEKRADARMLAEEIVKVMDEERDKNRLRWG